MESRTVHQLRQSADTFELVADAEIYLVADRINKVALRLTDANGFIVLYMDNARFLALAGLMRRETLPTTDSAILAALERIEKKLPTPTE